MKEQLHDYDPAAALTDPEAVTVFLADAFETGDVNHITEALGIIARAKGIREVADATDLSRENLYKALSEKGNPTLRTLLAVTRSLGVELTVRKHAPA